MADNLVGPTFSLSTQYENGTLSVSDSAAEAMGVTSLERTGRTDKPGSQPWIAIKVVGPGESNIPKGQHFSYEATLTKHNQLDVRVGVDHPEVQGANSSVNEHLLAKKLGATLAERLHNNRMSRIALLGAGAVLLGFAVKSGIPYAFKDVLTYAATAGTYIALRVLGKVTRPGLTGSNSSYDYAGRVVENARGSMHL